MPSVSVVIPAKNEARNLEHVFATIPEWVDEIVLVDGHSDGRHRGGRAEVVPGGPDRPPAGPR